MPADPGAPGDPASCSVMASRLFGAAARVDGVHRDLARLGDRTGAFALEPAMDALDALATDLAGLAESVQRLAADLAKEHTPGATRAGDRVRTGRSHAALERVARRIGEAGRPQPHG